MQCAICFEPIIKDYEKQEIEEDETIFPFIEKYCDPASVQLYKEGMKSWFNKPVSTSCAHIFHAKCFTQFPKKECPLCRNPIEIDLKLQEGVSAPYFHVLRVSLKKGNLEVAERIFNLVRNIEPFVKEICELACTTSKQKQGLRVLTYMLDGDCVSTEIKQAAYLKAVMHQRTLLINRLKLERDVDINNPLARLAAIYNSGFEERVERAFSQHP